MEIFMNCLKRYLYFLVLVSGICLIRCKNVDSENFLVMIVDIMDCVYCRCFYLLCWLLY